MVPSSKAGAHFQFFSPDSAEGKEISNVLIKYKPSDELFPFKAGVVATMVTKALGRKFSVGDHTTSWKTYKVRPSGGVVTSDKVNNKYCIYHKAHGDFTFNQTWVDFLISENAKPKGQTLSAPQMPKAG